MSSKTNPLLDLKETEAVDNRQSQKGLIDYDSRFSRRSQVDPAYLPTLLTSHTARNKPRTVATPPLSNALYNFSLEKNRRYDMNGQTTTLYPTPDELVSILVLCAHLCLVLCYFRTSIARRKQLYTMLSSPFVQRRTAQQESLVDEDPGSFLSYPATDYFAAINIADEVLSVNNIQNFHKARKRPRRVTFDMSRNSMVEFSAEMAPAPRESRRHLRVRDATRRSVKGWWRGRCRFLDERLRCTRSL